MLGIEGGGYLLLEADKKEWMPKSTIYREER